MENKMLLPLTLLMIICPLIATGHDSNGTWQNHEHHLYDDLMKNYFKYGRPVKNENSPVNVSFGMTLVNLVDLVEKDQVLITNGWLRYWWKDENLSWKPEDYGGVTTINIPINEIWHPDITLYNSHDGQFPIANEVLPVVNMDGTVFYIPPATISSRCPMDMTHFPYDTQTCILKFGSWVHSSLKMNLTHFMGEDKMDMTSYEPHYEWEITHHEGKLNAKKYDCCPERYLDITYTIKLRRISTYTTHVFMAPSIVCALIVPSVFLIPADSGEKITLGTGLLVTQSLLLVMLEIELESAHPTVPLLAIYMVVNITLIALSLVFASISTNFWYRQWQMPNFVRTVILGVFGRIMCVNRDNYTDDDEPLTFRRLELADMGNDEPSHTADDKARMMNQYRKKSLQAEWRQLSVIIDRFLFIIFLVIAIILAVIMQ